MEGFLAENQIHFGNSFELMDGIRPGSVRLTLTSPPYPVRSKKYDVFKNVEPNNFATWFMPFVCRIQDVLAENGSFILNVNDCVVGGFRSVFVFDLVCRIVRETRFKLWERIFWSKGKFLPNGYRFGDKAEYVFWFAFGKDFVFNLDEMRRPYNPISIRRMKKPIKRRFARTLENNDSQKYKNWAPHPNGAMPSTVLDIGSESKRVSNDLVAVFPLKFAEYFVKGATDPGDLVLDPFAGIGTACLAAKNLGRRFVGIDISEGYCIQARKRLGIFHDQKQPVST